MSITTQERNTNGIVPLNKQPAYQDQIKTITEDLNTIDIAITPAYKKYVALMTQSGTGAPTATILENTLGGTLVWTRDSSGTYIGTLVGAFPVQTKVGGFCGTYNLGSAEIAYKDADSIYLLASVNDIADDDCLLNTLIEIRVYN